MRATRATRARPRPESGTRSTARSSSADAASVRRRTSPSRSRCPPRDHPRSHRRRRLARRRRELLGARPRHRDDEVEPIEERARHLLAVGGDPLRAAAAVGGRIAPPTARAQVHRRDEPEARRERARDRRRARPRRRRPRAAAAATRARGAGTRAARRASSTPRWARLASPGRGTAPPPTIAAADAPWCGARNGGSEHDRAPGRQRSRDRVDPRHLERLVAGERRQDARQTPAEHRLAGARRPGEEHVVLAGRGDLERPPPPLLPAHLGEVGHERLLELVAAGRRRERGCPPRRAGRRPPGRDGATGTTSIPASAASGADSAAQMRRFRPARRTPSATAIVPATGRTRPSSESSPTQACSSRRCGRQLVRAGEDGEGDRQVEARAFLAQRGRSEVDGDPVARGPRQHRVDDPALHPVLRLLTGAIGEPDDRERGQVGREEVRLDVDPARLEPDDGGGESAREHASDGTPECVPCRRTGVRREWARSSPLSGRRRRESTRSTRPHDDRCAG